MQKYRSDSDSAPHMGSHPSNNNNSTNHQPPHHHRSFHYQSAPYPASQSSHAGSSAYAPVAPQGTINSNQTMQYYPLATLGNYHSQHHNTAYSSPPVPLYTKRRSNHPAGDLMTSSTTTDDVSSARSEYLDSSTRNSSNRSPTLTSQYYPHTNLMPIAQPHAQPHHTSSNPAGFSHPVPVVQPLRPHNVLHSSHPHHHIQSPPQPLIPHSNRYIRSSVPPAQHQHNGYTPTRPSAHPGSDQENRQPTMVDPSHLHHHHRQQAPPTVAAQSPPAGTTSSRSGQDHNQLSDKQILRARFAQRGVLLDKTERIGSGRYSKVMTAGLKDGSTIAIKIINTTRVTTEFRTKFLPREIECWDRLRHPHLVKLLHRDEIGGRVFLFMEFGGGGDMLAHVQKNGPVHETTAALWMRQVISGIAHMHKLGLVHRDLKLENIIIFSPTTVKIADFGFARRMDTDLSATYCGSKSYSAPEILSGQPYNPYKADVWSMGVIAYVIVTDRMPFKDSMPNAEIVNAQKRRLYTYPPQLVLSATCRQTIDALLVFEAQGRPSIAEAARMPWFTPSTDLATTVPTDALLTETTVSAN